jgi:hypothetical protein
MVAPDKVAVDFLKEFQTLCRSWLDQRSDRRMILIIGGGGPAREYQGAYRKLVAKPENDRQDWIGIAATRLNAELVKQIFAPECQTPSGNRSNGSGFIPRKDFGGCGLETRIQHRLRCSGPGRALWSKILGESQQHRPNLYR